MRLIDADVLSQKWQNVLDQKANEKDSIVYYIFELFMDRLKYEPTIEAEPVRHGKYVLLYDTYGPMVCSECGGEAPSISMGSEYEESQYCPSCGAKMDGKEKKE